MSRSPWKCVFLFAVPVLAITLTARGLSAKEIGESEIASAKAAAKGGDPVRAGEILGGAVASAVKFKSLAAEQRAAEALEQVLDAVEKDASPDARGDALADLWPGRAKGREVLAAAMKGLDPKRHGLFVSAHALAASIVLDAVALGDAEHLTDAAKVLAQFKTTPGSGAAAGAFARLAEGVALARSGDAAKAAPALDDAARAFSANGWLFPALHAWLEITALRLAAGDGAKAGEALAAATAMLRKDADLVAAKDWMHAVETRCKAAPKDALEAFRKATQPYLAASEGTAGARGADASDGLTPFGKALPKWPSAKALVTVKRGTDGFDVRLAFDDKAAAKQAIGRGSRPWDASGVTLLLAGPSVALAVLDPKGDHEQPGERLRPSRAWAYYWLADGETWGATREGVVVSGP